MNKTVTDLYKDAKELINKTPLTGMNLFISGYLTG